VNSAQLMETDAQSVVEQELTVHKIVSPMDVHICNLMLTRIVRTREAKAPLLENPTESVANVSCRLYIPLETLVKPDQCVSREPALQLETIGLLLSLLELQLFNAHKLDLLKSADIMVLYNVPIPTNTATEMVNHTAEEAVWVKETVLLESVLAQQDGACMIAVEEQEPILYKTMTMLGNLIMITFLMHWSKSIFQQTKLNTPPHWMDSN